MVYEVKDSNMAHLMLRVVSPEKTGDERMCILIPYICHSPGWGCPFRRVFAQFYDLEAENFSLNPGDCFAHMSHEAIVSECTTRFINISWCICSDGLSYGLFRSPQYFTLVKKELRTTVELSIVTIGRKSPWSQKQLGHMCWVRQRNCLGKIHHLGRLFQALELFFFLCFLLFMPCDFRHFSSPIRL